MNCRRTDAVGGERAAGHLHTVGGPFDMPVPDDRPLDVCNDTQRQAPAAVGNGKMGPGTSNNEPKINKGDDSNIPGAQKQPAP